MTHILALDQGTTSSRTIVFDARSAPRRLCASTSLPSTTRPPAGSNMMPRRSGPASSPPPRSVLDKVERRRHRRHRHHQPARDHRDLGPRDRQADPQRDRLAGPAHRRHLRRAQGRGPRGHGDRSAPACCSTPISPPPRSPGCSTTSTVRASGPRRGELAFGTDRQLPDLAPDRRARYMSPTPPTPRARCSTTFARGAGTPTSAPCSACRWRCCPR